MAYSLVPIFDDDGEFIEEYFYGSFCDGFNSMRVDSDEIVRYGGKLSCIESIQVDSDEVTRYSDGSQYVKCKKSN